MSVDSWRMEIVELHAFFERWLGGACLDDATTFARVETALAPEFTFVTVSGAVLPRDALLAGLRAGHGSRPGLEIRIEDPVLHLDRDGTMVATYVEHQRGDGPETRRRSTAVLDARRGREERPLWLHVHETWISRGM